MLRCKKLFRGSGRWFLTSVNFSLTASPLNSQSIPSPTQSITGAFDPDQRRTEDSMTDEALTNKAESRDAIAFVARLVAIPIVSGALVGRALADPILSFTLANNPNAFAMTGRQKIEGSQHVHEEEARVRMLMAIGQAPPLNEREMSQHLREYAHEVGGCVGGVLQNVGRSLLAVGAAAAISKETSCLFSCFAPAGQTRGPLLTPTPLPT
jgi:hypothetical protein